MKQIMSVKFRFFLVLILAFVLVNSYGQEIPLVYSVENTGADCVAPPLPDFADLPSIDPLPDPFEWSDGSGRSTDFADWACRRAEIKAEIEHYEIGEKPLKPDTINATYVDGLLTVEIIENGDTLILTSNISLPEGEGPFPAVIGMGGGSGSLPDSLFSTRDIARIPFAYYQVMAHTQARGSEPINRLYPDLIYMGAYSAWSWGVSRLIDGLELVADSLPIDLTHLAVTGCSFAGKMALYSGAFDERIALTIVQESGGGGISSWRVAETLGNVEKLSNTNYTWFIQDLSRFSGSSAVGKLPFDHHELIAMIAPRAVFIIGNPSQTWLAEESGYVATRAASEVWKEFGIEDRIGFQFDPNHSHCALPSYDIPDIEAFIEKFLLDKESVNTDIATHTFESVDYTVWYDWWGSGDPVFPVRNYGIYYEAECANLGANWDIRQTGLASNGNYVTVKDDLESTSEAPSAEDDQFVIEFSVDKDTSYNVFLRLSSTSFYDDCFWVKLDDAEFVKYDEMSSIGWEWVKLNSFDLTAGEHSLTFAYCENGAYLDKICISDVPFKPAEMGGDAENSCTITPVGIQIELQNSYNLGQNYPNPFNEFTAISFEIPKSTYVSLKVYSVLGEEIAELAGKEYVAGKHTLEFDSRKLSNGVYFYTIHADGFSTSRKMIVQEE